MSNGTEAAANNPEDATRGRPYYEKLRKDLKQTLEEKRRLDEITQRREERILKLEAAYLEETSAAGNIVKGFDNYIKASASTSIATSSTGGGTATRRKGGISEQDKIFSRSSVTWSNELPPHLNLGINTSNGNGASNGGTASAAASGRNTPTSTSGPGHKGNMKKRKSKVDVDDEDDKSVKRSKISWGRD